MIESDYWSDKNIYKSKHNKIIWLSSLISHIKHFEYYEKKFERQEKPSEIENPII